MLENSAGYAAMGVTGTADMGMYSYLEDQYYVAIDKVRASGKYLQRFVGCTCHDKRTEMAGNDDTPKRIKNQRWENLAKSGERTGKV